MKRPSLSPSDFLLFLRRREKLSQLEKRKRRLYNRAYRKSKLFIACWIMRIIYFAVFFYVAASFKKSGSFRVEILNGIYRHTSANSMPGLSRIDFIRITTNLDTYSSLPGDIAPPRLKPGDTLFVERNIFDKPIHFSKKGEHFRFPIFFNSLIYIFVLFFSFISFFFNDGLDPFTHKLLWLMWTLNILSIAVFFWM